MTERLEGKIEKGWGYELIWATNEKYCGKIMVFEKVGSKFSLHFHKEKDESWFVNNGKFLWEVMSFKISYKKLNEFVNIFKIFQITLFAPDISSTYKNKLTMISKNSLFFCKIKN